VIADDYRLKQIRAARLEERCLSEARFYQKCQQNYAANDFYSHRLYPVAGNELTSIFDWMASPRFTQTFLAAFHTKMIAFD
jgi:hypothetical protein